MNLDPVTAHQRPEKVKRALVGVLPHLPAGVGFALVVPLPFLVVELDLYTPLGPFAGTHPGAVGVGDQDPDLAAVPGLVGEEVGDAVGFEDVEERFVEQVDSVGRVAHQGLPVGRGGVVGGWIGGEKIARQGRGWSVGRCCGEFGPELVFGGVERTGDFAAVAGVGGHAGQPASDGLDVNLDDLREVVGLQSGVLQR